jgi:hypothetical protein
MASVCQAKTAIGGVRTGPIIWLVFLAGCSANMQPVGLSDLENRDPAQRIRAIKWAGENKVQAAVPLLVDRLQEQDSAVRFYAIEALRRITGTDRGYDYKADAASRAQAVARWRASLGQPTAGSEKTSKE